ncbi:MAG: CvpA family protein [Chitinophagaceae bacterium]
MMIDIIFVILMIVAFVKGWRKGLIVALFSVIAFVVGIAAAMKLSVVVADYLKDSVQVSARWLPFLSFIIVFVAVVLLIRWGASLIEAAVDITLLGWANRLAGAVLYLLLYSIGFSIVLFFVQKVHMVQEETTARSVFFPYIQPLGPLTMEAFGKLVPVFKDMFTSLEGFFDHLAERAKQ